MGSGCFPWTHLNKSVHTSEQESPFPLISSDGFRSPLCTAIYSFELSPHSLFYEHLMSSPGEMRAKGTERGRGRKWSGGGGGQSRRGVWFADEETEAHGAAVTSGHPESEILTPLEFCSTAQSSPYTSVPSRSMWRGCREGQRDRRHPFCKPPLASTQCKEPH